MDIQNPYWIAYRNIRPEVKDRYMLYASLKYDITNYLNVAGRVRLDNTYTEKEDKRYASTINTYASTNGRYTYSNETFRQKYADIMVNFDKQFAEIYHATINAGTSFEEYDTKGRGYGGQKGIQKRKSDYSSGICQPEAFPATLYIMPSLCQHMPVARTETRFHGIRSGRCDAANGQF